MKQESIFGLQLASGPASASGRSACKLRLVYFKLRKPNLTERRIAEPIRKVSPKFHYQKLIKLLNSRLCVSIFGSAY